MSTRLALYLLLIGLSVYKVKCARILCVFSMPAISHQSVFRIYTQELARKGHELVIITTIPSLHTDMPSGNVTEIDVGPLSFKLLENSLKNIKNKGLYKRGIILDLEAYLDDSMIAIYSKLCIEQLRHPDIVKLINDSNQRFDLLIIEANIDIPLILSKIFKVPVILFSSFYGYSQNYDTFGAFKHPLLYPDSFRNDFGGVTLTEKIKGLYWEWRVLNFYSKVKNVGDELLKNEFGSDAPTIDELRNNVDLLFLNVNHMFDGNRPVPSSVKYLGSLHMQPPKDIPKDLKTHLDNSKEGVVYVSFGTIAQPSDMDKEFMDSFLEAFKRLKYDILWKFDADNIEVNISNVKTQKWFPQRDLLMHPNVKAFITQGGLQSTDEAIDAAVPIVGIPLLADQWYNMHKSEQFGIGVKLDSFTLTADDIIKGVTTVIENENYKQNILKLRSLIHDQQETSLQRAIWWTEYVLRHGGMRHLRAPGANLSWSEYLMLDVVLPVVTILIVLILIFFTAISYIIKCFFMSSNVKLKQD